MEKVLSFKLLADFFQYFGVKIKSVRESAHLDNVFLLTACVSLDSSFTECACAWEP